MESFGVILLNMGGPTSLDAVRPCLQNLFLDREIISFGPMEFLRGPLARLIAGRRAEKVRENYAMIGGKSPIAEASRRQADALRGALASRLPEGVKIRVEFGFSYWHPFIEEAMEALAADGISHVFLMPLYPHYSRTTTGSCFKTWRNLHRAKGNGRFRVLSVKDYPIDPGYVAALNARIDEALSRFPASRRAGVTVLFSAHGTPVKLVEQGDPYSFQIRATVEAVMKERTDGLAHELSFQSKVGPARWLQPDTVGKARELAARGVRDLLVVPVAFVSDHVETLHELDIELRKEALNAGIENFVLMPALDCHPCFIAALADRIGSAASRRWSGAGSVGASTPERE